MDDPCNYLQQINRMVKEMPHMYGTVIYVFISLPAKTNILYVKWFICGVQQTKYLLIR